MERRGTYFTVGLGAIALLAGCWQSPQTQRTEGPVNYRNEPVNFTNTNVNEMGNANSTPERSPETEEKPRTGFMANLPEAFEMPTDEVGRKLLREYGSVFVARGQATPPEKVVFRDEGEVSRFQSSLATVRAEIGGFTLELQSPAMAALQDAVNQARKKGLTISPRGQDSAKRTYSETVGLWNSRVDPALKHWVGKGRLTQADADRIKRLSTFEQVSEVLKLEDQGIYFAKDLSKSIIYSVAPPGTSQHLSLLAFDVKEFDNAEVRRILADNGWFQTVASDLPHFTFLGVKESELQGLGLKKTVSGGRDFWVPDI
ncbi:MAG TPA: hypothetical protein PKD24_05730 [Pyrinomonadaceae bacterium]|nr:hypothetical protein [Pyrinomonadaceae bacterium]HMP65051.1 hypothetical protein [Pyrinomonadaceae bacterium]